MTPGRALDALVAEKVMGLTVIHEPEWGKKVENAIATVDDLNKKDTYEVGDYWVNSLKTNLLLSAISFERMEWRVKPYVDSPEVAELGYYSTEIADAWGVVEKMRSLRHPVRIFSDQTHKGNLWVVQYVEREFGTMTGMSAEDTLPHAICLAALKALGVDVSTAPASPSQTP